MSEWRDMNTCPKKGFVTFLLKDGEEVAGFWADYGYGAYWESVESDGFPVHPSKWKPRKT